MALHHVSVGTNDLDRAQALYDPVMEVIRLSVSTVSRFSIRSDRDHFSAVGDEPPTYLGLPTLKGPEASYGVASWGIGGGTESDPIRSLVLAREGIKILVEIARMKSAFSPTILCTCRRRQWVMGTPA